MVVKKVYKLSLSPSLCILPINLILEKVKPLVDDSFVYELISSFLRLPIIGSARLDRKGIPPAGEISRVIFDIVLKEIFDREFAIKFPDICFYRFKHEVIILTREEDEVNFDEQVGYDLLKELGLEGVFESMGPGEKPIICNDKILHMDSDSHKVIMYDRESIYL